MLKRVAPLSYEAWIDYDVCAAHVSRMELDVLRALLRGADDGVAAQPGKLSRLDLEAKGLSKREIGEFLAMLEPRSVPDFELDLSKAKPATFFEQEAAAAIPKNDAKPGE
jgi:hypothetical protein